MFSFNIDKVNFDQILGSGNFGAVYPYQKHPDDKKWVVKHIMTPNTDLMLKHFNEIVLGFSCDHPNVLPIKGYNIHLEPKQKSWNIYLKIPRMKESLKEKLTRLAQEDKFLTEKEVIQHFYAISSGLAYLHGRSISHNDVKPDNILIDAEGVIRVADIGIGEFVEGETSYDVLAREGTASYSAPEVLDRNFDLKKGDLIKSDAWSLGVLMAELCLMKFRLVNVLLPGQAKQAEFYSHLGQAKGRYSEDLLRLIMGLLRADPAERSSVSKINSILKHKYADLLDLKNSDKPIENLFEEQKIKEEEEFMKLKSFSFDQPNENMGVLLPNTFADNDKIQKYNKDLEKKWSKIFHLEFRQDENRLEALLDVNARLTEFDTRTFIKDIEINKKESFKELDGMILSCRGNKHLTDKAVTEIVSQIGSNLKFLKSLALNFTKCEELTDTSINEITNKIPAFLKSLHTLRLQFNFCTKITDSSVQKLFTAIGLNLKKLNHLNLAFNYCNQLSDKIINELALQLKLNLLSLETLNLCFNSCDKLTDFSIRGLLAFLPQNTLRSLILHLMGCKKITDQTINELSTQTKSSLKALTTLIILFYECDQITDAAVSGLVNHIILNMKSLKFLMLYFEKCSRVTSQTTKYIQTLFSSITGLTFFIVFPNNLVVAFF